MVLILIDCAGWLRLRETEGVSMNADVGARTSLWFPSDNRKHWSQLIILGNGFDLECGLHSRFEDFFKDRMVCLGAFDWSRQDCTDEQLKSYFSSHDLTAWDIALSESAKRNWFDVEKEIKYWVVPPSNHTISSPLQKVLGRISPNECAGYAPDSYHRGMDIGRYLLNERPINRYIKMARYIRCSDEDALGGRWKKGQVLDFLLSELHKLEECFVRFLNDELSQNQAYSQEYARKLFDLIVDEIADPEHKKISSSILNFNYTSPSFDSDDVPGEVSTINVHGSIDRDIIFGIDGMERWGDSSSLPYTKTFRVMTMAGFLPRELLRPLESAFDEGLFECIKFYGHSLAEADYSYFQSIFDTVDLYQSRTKLIFYYVPHGDMTFAQSKEAMVNKAISLVHSYGETLDNASHGKNLAHKLLLEGRLSVKVAPWWNAADDDGGC